MIESLNFPVIVIAFCIGVGFGRFWDYDDGFDTGYEEGYKDCLKEHNVNDLYRH